MKVTIFGIGYVGLVQAAVLAEIGHQVVCVDVDENKVANLKEGIIPIYEPGLTPLVQSNFAAGRLNFTTDAHLGIKHSDILFIAVGTPPDEDGSADLKYVTAVARKIAEYMDCHKIVVDKSTVPVGTADKVKQEMQTILTKRNANLTFDVVSNPEFLKEGVAVDDCMKPERIIIGADTPRAFDIMADLYAHFNQGHNRIINMDIRSAELTKYAANCILATKISFINEIANLAELLGADIEQVRQGIGADPRIGYHFISPGCGYGGSCFPKDVLALIRTAEQHNYQPTLLHAVDTVNNKQKQKLFDLVQQHYHNDLRGKKFALWGLSFKPNTDDMREAPSRTLMEALWQAGAKVNAFDPEAMNETRRIYGEHGDLTLCDNKEAVLDDADALIICTEWTTFKEANVDIIKEKLKDPVIFDGRNLYDPIMMANKDIHYYAIGRGMSVKKIN